MLCGAGKAGKGTSKLWGAGILAVLALVMHFPVHGHGMVGYTMAPEARAYLDDALDIMERSSINRKTLDWAAIRGLAYDEALGATSLSDTYPAIKLAVRSLGDNHSGFLTPKEASNFRYREEVQGRRIDDRIGYVRIPAFTGEDADAFAKEIQGLVQEFDGPDLDGWVIDVRGNGGGSMHPMLQGIAPLLGDDPPGYFLDPDGNRTPWQISAWSDPQQLSQPDLPVAVLHDGKTASSGEAVVVAFRGRPRSRSFGQPTRGLSTGNSTIALSDGARLIVTMGTMVDRDGVEYGGVIEPDETVPAEQALVRAKEWLEKMGAGND